MPFLISASRNVHWALLFLHPLLLLKGKGHCRLMYRLSDASAAVNEVTSTNLTIFMSLSLRFNGHFPGEPGLAGVY